MNFRLHENLLLGAGARLGEGIAPAEGLGCCRLELDWSRIESADGVFDEGALAACRRELQALSERGLRPLLVLHRFRLPSWLEQRGGFTHTGSVTCYLRYVRGLIETLGDLAGDYITFDEPNLWAFSGHLPGGPADEKRSLLAAARSLTNFAAAHIESYGLIRKTRLQMGFSDTRVGISCQLRVFAPRHPQDPVHRFWASRSRQLFQGSLIRAVCLGRVSFPIGRHPSIVPGHYCDFHAPSYAGRSLLSSPALPAEREAYPDGAVQLCRELWELLPLPIHLTAPWVSPRYTVLQLRALCESGLPVESCCCRAPGDGGEAAAFYRALTAQGGISEALWNQYCTGEEEA